MELVAVSVGCEHVLPVLGNDRVITHLNLLLQVAFFEQSLSYFVSFVINSDLAVVWRFLHELVSELYEFVKHLSVVRLLELALGEGGLKADAFFVLWELDIYGQEGTLFLDLFFLRLVHQGCLSLMIV